MRGKEKIRHWGTVDVFSRKSQVWTCGLGNQRKQSDGLPKGRTAAPWGRESEQEPLHPWGNTVKTGIRVKRRRSTVLRPLFHYQGPTRSQGSVSCKACS